MKILTLLGDYYHSHDQLLAFIQSTTKKIDGAEVNDTSIENLKEHLEEQPDVLIISKENRREPEEEDQQKWLTDELDQSIATYVEKGGNLFVLHSGLSSYPENSRYQNLIKGKFLHHPEHHTMISFDGYAPDFGTLSFRYSDEHYFVEVKEKETEIFLKSSSSEGESIAGWRHQAGEGRIICLTPTHSEEGYVNGDLQKLFLQALEWVTSK
ncbi:ThuA domain-containing protein [Jeotgalibaca sp. MA1X17-3]|uniref:ThuA domain-containing protein n=1 Tax=Jeotgalibaca sp. MA1X17-3 TaxID=2908211 RepID=UPI001F2FE73E|nr:ThuA domain-containing protein [Jeotgalibaca sp. MA1X17-3]UJF16338.1 ThuA domain-containing protein [Jeotgalibaca sp. MA1X17-3]